MGDLADAFKERLVEIDAYLDLLDEVQRQVGSGGRAGLRVTEQQQRILHSSVYLQLYNLVESTITRCVDAISEAVAAEGRWRPHDLSEQLRRQWIRSILGAHDDPSLENRFEEIVRLTDAIIAARPISRFTIAKGGGGNWDDTQIEKFTERRLGFTLNIPSTLRTEIKRRRRDDRGALELIRKLRNALAHGHLSFEQCGANDTVSDLRLLKKWTAEYLREVVLQFEAFIEAHEFLQPGCRPGAVE
jgi:hypothetical protein